MSTAGRNLSDSGQPIFYDIGYRTDYKAERRF